MMKLKLLLLGSLFAMVGCTDTIDSITREYRNCINESVDALTVIKDDESARRMRVRVFNMLPHRFKDIDNKIKIVQTNRTKAEFIKETFESDGFQLYLTDLEVNRQRMGLEVTRLRNLVSQLVKRERQLLDEAGFPDQEVNLTELCPNLNKLVVEESMLDPLVQQLKEPRLLQIVSGFPSWKVNGYENMFAKFVERRAAFKSEPIKLID